MKNMQSILQRVPEALLTVTDNVGHYRELNRTDKYIVWAEDGEGDSVEGDNRKINQSIQGTIDYFTLSENDGNVDKIQAGLNGACISFYLNSVQFEDRDDGGAGYIHYEWVFEVE